MTSFHNIKPRRPLKAGRLAAIIAALVALAAVSLATGAPAPALAQPGEEWRIALGGPADEFAHAVALSGDGGYVIAGETRSYGAGAQDGWLVKLDANGRRQWARAYGGPQSDVLYSVQKTSDGGYILAGETASPASDADPDATSTPPQSDFWLIKTNAYGLPQWERNYGGIEHILSPAAGPPQTASLTPMPLQETAYAVRQTRDGGYILAGSSVGTSGAGVWLLRTAPDGELLWSRNPGVAPGAVAHSVAETPDSGFIIAGHAQTPDRGADALLIKTDADGNTAWTKSYGGQYNDEARALTLTADGGYALAGFTWSDSAGLSDFWLVKTGPNGKQQWQRSYGGPYSDAAHALIPTADGGYAPRRLVRIPKPKRRRPFLDRQNRPRRPPAMGSLLPPERPNPRRRPRPAPNRGRRLYRSRLDRRHCGRPRHPRHQNRPDPTAPPRPRRPGGIPAKLRRRRHHIRRHRLPGARFRRRRHAPALLAQRAAHRPRQPLAPRRRSLHPIGGRA